MSRRPRLLHRFFDRPTVWKAFAFVLGYLAFYLAVGFVVDRLSGVQLSMETVLEAPRTILVGLTLPIGITALALIALARAIGWLKPLFAPQPIAGRGWMWIAPGLVVASVVLHLASADWSAFPASSLLLLALTGLFIGVAEELVTRGFVVKMLRDAGRSEWFVMVVSSLLFGVMHAVNLLSGQDLVTTLAQLAFAFGFGVCMYLTLRVTGSLVYPILLHACYDPSLFIATGGINRTADGSQGAVAGLAGLTTVLFLLFSLVALVLVRGRVAETTRED